MEQLLIKLFSMTVTAGYCALIVLVVRFLLKKLPKTYSYILWFVVFFRFLCPVSLEGNFSLLKLQPQFPMPMEEKVQIPEVSEQTELRTTGAGSADETVTDGIREPKETVTDGIRESDKAVTDGIREPEETATDESRVPKETAAVVREGQETVQMGNITGTVICAIWLTAAVFLILYHVCATGILKKQLKAAERKEKNIYTAVNLRTPFVFGSINPRIYLPAYMEERERQLVVEHEKIHMKRKDYLVKQLAYLAVCIHWFNPMAWISYYFMCKDMEMSCDELVIRNLGQKSKKDYSLSLLSFAAGEGEKCGTVLAFGEGNVKKRIVNVLHYQELSIGKKVLCGVILMGIMAAMMLDPVTQVQAQGMEMGLIQKPDWGSISLASAGWKEEAQKIFDEKGYTESSGEEDEEGYREPVLHLYVPEFYIKAGYTDLEQMPEEKFCVFAKQALRELYEITGTQIEECYYYYDNLGCFSFGLTPEDLEHSRIFYSRTFGSEDREEFFCIPSMYVANARRVWYSPVYQYELPQNLDAMNSEEKAVWFVTHSALYKGQKVRECTQPYPGSDFTWRVVMEDDSVYEIDLDQEIDSFYNIAGPYPEGEINH